MDYTIHETTVDITCTFAELVKMDSLDHGIYATPTPDGLANQLYLSHQPHRRDDFLLATVEDFCEEEGWSSLGWEGMTDEELATAEAETDPITITVPRAKMLGT
jgi:hypothetical protein